MNGSKEISIESPAMPGFFFLYRPSQLSMGRKLPR
jgi:hypothetical protein